jgi:hypothetical protein
VRKVFIPITLPPTLRNVEGINFLLNCAPCLPLLKTSSVNNIYFSILPKHPAHCEKTLAVPHEIVRKQGYACLRKNVEITQSLLSGVTKVRGA